MRRYLTAGFYEKDDTIPLLLALQEGGADVSFCCLPHHAILRKYDCAMWAIGWKRRVGRGRGAEGKRVLM